MFNLAIDILDILSSSGFKAYIVGGYLRDKILNINSTDIDICTDATPEELKIIFKESLNIDNYGSCRLSVFNYVFEITTLRNDFNYIKSRKPGKVVYVDTIEEDYKRRDFTINALYMDKDQNLIDLCNSIDDINNKVIRTIGEPDTRLKEDSLRILRAIRFSTILNFSIDKELEIAIFNNKNLLKELSNTRRKEELNKIFSSDNYKLGLYLLNKYDIPSTIGLDIKNKIVKTTNVLGMWAQIDIKEDYNFSNKDKKYIQDIKEIINYGKIDSYIKEKYSVDEINTSLEILKGDDYEK